MIKYILFLLIPFNVIGLNPERTRGTSEITIAPPTVNVTVQGTNNNNNNNNTVSLQSPDDFPENLTVDTVIKKEDITTQGMILNEQGKVYKLENGVEYTGNTSMFTIAAANVTIDLNGRRIRYRGDRTKIVDAITFAPSIKSATIKNGIIVAFTGAAIDATSIESNLTVNISLKNLLVANCHKGIILKNVSNSILNNIRIYRNRPKTGDVYGIKLDSTQDVKVDNCSIIENLSNDGKAHGFLLTNNRNCIIKNCKSLNNIGYFLSSGFCIKNSSEYNNISHCESYSNIATNGPSYGFFLSDVSAITLENNKAINNKTENSLDNSYGFYLKYSHTSLLMNNKSEKNDYGFYDTQHFPHLPNMFIGNHARQNKIDGFIRTSGQEINHIKIDSDFLQKGLSASPFDNVTISAK